MEFDELRASWAALDRKLERTFSLERQRLARDAAGEARRSILRGRIGRFVELALGAVVAWVTIQVVAAHGASLRYILLGGGVAALALLVTISNGVAWWRANSLEPSGGVVAIQRAIESLRRFEFRVLKWVFALGVVLWLPALAIVFEWLTGIEVLARISGLYLGANVAFGVVVAGIVFHLARRYVEHDFESALARKVVDALTGSGLRRAEARLRELDEFRAETA